jgi:hypothetical protein
MIARVIVRIPAQHVENHSPEKLADLSGLRQDGGAHPIRQGRIAPGGPIPLIPLHQGECAQKSEAQVALCRFFTVEAFDQQHTVSAGVSAATTCYDDIKKRLHKRVLP